MRNNQHFSFVARGLVLASVTAAVLLQATPAWAPCPPPNTFRGQVRGSDAVWVGTILTAHVRGEGAKNWRLRVQVDRVLKGPAIGDPVIVFMSFGGPYGPYWLPSQAAGIRRGLEGSKNVLTVQGPDSAGRYLWSGPNGCGGKAPVAPYLERATSLLGVQAGQEQRPTVGASPLPWILAGALIAAAAVTVSLLIGVRARRPS